MRTVRQIRHMTHADSQWADDSALRIVCWWVMCNCTDLADWILPVVRIDSSTRRGWRMRLRGRLIRWGTASGNSHWLARLSWSETL